MGKTIKEIRAEKKGEAEAIATAATGQDIVDTMSSLLPVVGALLNTDDGQKLAGVLMLFDELAEHAAKKCKVARKNLISEDEQVKVVFTPKTTEFRVSPEEFEEIMEKCPEACSVKKTVLLKEQPELFARLNNDAHLVQTGYEKASVTSKGGYQTMMDRIQQYIDAINAAMGGSE